MSDSDFDPSLAGLNSQNGEYNKKTTNLAEGTIKEYPDPFRYLRFILMFCLVVFVMLKIYSGWQNSRPLYTEYFIPDKKVYVSALSDEMRSFLFQNQSLTDKRMLMYAPELKQDTCPYRRPYYNALKEVKNDSQWVKFYDFIPQMDSFYANSEEERKMKLRYLREFRERICGYVCIVDIHENWVFQINNPSSLVDALNAFKK